MFDTTINGRPQRRTAAGERTLLEYQHDLAINNPGKHVIVRERFVAGPTPKGRAYASK